MRTTEGTAPLEQGGSAAVQFTLRDGVATVELNRPHRLNAITTAVVQELLAAFARATDTGARAVVLAGAGRAFCSGHDLKEPLPEEDEHTARQRVEQLQDITRVIKAFRGPVIAAVQSWAVGAGCELALACDLVVAASGTRFAFPEVGVGLAVTNGVTQMLGTVIGPQRAKHLLWTGAVFTAEEAQAWGLVNTVVPEGHERECALSMARDLLQAPPVALALAKEGIDRGFGSSLEAALATEVEISMRLDPSELAQGTRTIRADDGKA